MPSFLLQFSFSQISPLPFHPPSQFLPQGTILRFSLNTDSPLLLPQFLSFLLLLLPLPFPLHLLCLSFPHALNTCLSSDVLESRRFPRVIFSSFFSFFFFFAAITDRRASCYFPGVSIRNNEKSFSRSSLVLPAKWYACTVHRTRFAPGDPFVTGMYFEAVADGFFHRRIRLINLTAWIWNVFLPSTFTTDKKEGTRSWILILLLRPAADPLVRSTVVRGEWACSSTRFHAECERLFLSYDFNAIESS